MTLPIPFPASTISLPYGAVDGKYYTAGSPHRGTDFSSRSQGVVAGTVFRASGDGVVTRSGVGPVGVTPSMTRPNSLAGNSIDVDYGDVIVRYMHRPTGSPSPAEGDLVVLGSPLGVVGSTGQVSAAHLHMETWDKATGLRVDPARFFDFTWHVGDGQTASANAAPFDADPGVQTIEELPMNIMLYLYVPTNKLLLVDHLNKTIRDLGNSATDPLRAHYATLSYTRAYDKGDTRIGVDGVDWAKVATGYRYI